MHGVACLAGTIAKNWPVSVRESPLLLQQHSNLLVAVLLISDRVHRGCLHCLQLFILKQHMGHSLKPDLCLCCSCPLWLDIARLKRHGFRQLGSCYGQVGPALQAKPNRPIAQLCGSLVGVLNCRCRLCLGHAAISGKSNPPVHLKQCKRTSTGQQGKDQQPL
eukprot:1641795-Amphidinium_carterae.1